MKKLIAIASLFLLPLSIFAQVKTNFTKQNYAKFFKEDCVPKDLYADNHILLVQTPFEENETAKNKEIEDLFKANYTHPYIIVPSKTKDFKKTYANTGLYKYAVTFSKNIVNYDNSGTANDILHVHYELSIVDRVKLSKNTFPEMPEGLSKKEKEKFFKEIQKNKDSYTYDSTAIIKTGLEDNQSKLVEMLTFLITKLN